MFCYCICYTSYFLQRTQYARVLSLGHYKSTLNPSNLRLFSFFSYISHVVDRFYTRDVTFHSARIVGFHMDKAHILVPKNELLPKDWCICRFCIAASGVFGVTPGIPLSCPIASLPFARFFFIALRLVSRIDSFLDGVQPIVAFSFSFLLSVTNCRGGKTLSALPFNLFEGNEMAITRFSSSASRTEYSMLTFGASWIPYVFFRVL